METGSSRLRTKLVALGLFVLGMGGSWIWFAGSDDSPIVGGDSRAVAPSVRVTLAETPRTRDRGRNDEVADEIRFKPKERPEPVGSNEGRPRPRTAAGPTRSIKRSLPAA